MNGLPVSLLVDDFEVLLTAVRAMPACRPDDRARVVAEASRLMDLFERVAPYTDWSSTAMDVARSRLLMGQLGDALDRIGKLLAYCARKQRATSVL